MTKELETYFANYNEMFNSAGWKQLIGDLQANVAQINSVEATTDVENLHFRKGQLAILATLFNLPAQMEMLKKTHRSLMRKKKLRQKQRPLPKKSDAETL